MFPYCSSLSLPVLLIVSVIVLDVWVAHAAPDNELSPEFSLIPYNSIFLEAEDTALGDSVAVDAKHDSYTGTGYADFKKDGSIEWTVNLPEPGLYLLEFRYVLGSGSDKPERPLDISTVQS